MRQYKRADCSTCGPRSYFRKEIEHFSRDGLTYRWVCAGCERHALPYHGRRAPGTATDSPTPSQRRALERLQRELALFRGKHQSDYEWKLWEVTTTDYGPIWLSCEYNRKDCEGSALELFPDRWHIQIGPMGGLTFHDAPRWDSRKKKR